VKRVLLPSSAFLRAARRLAKRHPAMGDDLQAALELLVEDAHHPALRTHKLKGKLAKSWACSAGYNMRIVFQFVRHGAQEAILLEAVGTHDEVYESSQPHLEFPVRECTRGWRQGPREQSGRRKDARQLGTISRERRERTAEGKQGTRSPPHPKPQSQTPSDLL